MSAANVARREEFDRMSNTLWLASCVHLGEKSHDSGLLAEYLCRAKSERWDIALLGDILDMGLCFGTKHIGSVWENDKNPSEQIDLAVDTLREVRSQILGFATGNHAQRMENITSVNPEKVVANRLNRPYWGVNKILRWNGYNFFLAHGASGGIMPDFHKVLQAYDGLDVIALAHVHNLLHLPLRRFRVDGHGRTTERRIHLIRTGNFLKDPAYGRRALYPPTDLGSAIITNTKDGLKVKLGL